ncbi:cupin domain-containing protein [Tropicimonas aquimaris]|uniref:Cupin domain-containing protein n=1 Tax=Tropicimonas aquimaris TaxID=914152 RepID=A0ABW3IX13_9RHOB
MPEVEGAPHSDTAAPAFLQGRARIRATRGAARWLRFSLSRTAPEGADVLHAKKVTIDQKLALLRLDTVSFPPGACAWRHVHPGPGLRHLLQGELTLQTDDHDTVVTAGDSWFEAANSPVRATASATMPKTGFVRFLVLPVSLQGTPSIRILDAADTSKPTLQVTHRNLDQVVRLPSG